MKILVVCQYYAPEPFRIADICEEFVAQGHEVFVVTGTPNYPEGTIYPGYQGGAHRDEIQNGVRVHRCPIHPRKKGGVNRLWNYYSFVWASHQYLRHLEEAFDVVFSYQLSPVMMAESALSWAKRHGKKCVLYCLDLWPESLVMGGIRTNSMIYRRFWKISRRIYEQADAIAITSKSFSKYFEEVLQLPDQNLRYLPQYAEALFEELPTKPVHSGQLNAVFAGNIGEAQSVETIVQAAQRLKNYPQIVFHIVGDGVRLDACRRMADGLPNIIFYGRRDLSEMPFFYALADVMLVTLTDQAMISATLPGKVQSYLAAGKAIVGAANGETAAVIADAGCGLCGPAKDAETLAEHLQQLLKQPEQLQQYSKCARAYYQTHFQKEAFMKTLIALLKENI